MTFANQNTRLICDDHRPIRTHFCPGKTMILESDVLHLFFFSSSLSFSLIFHLANLYQAVACSIHFGVTNVISAFFSAWMPQMLMQPPHKCTRALYVIVSCRPNLDKAIICQIIMPNIELIWVPLIGLRGKKQREGVMGLKKTTVLPLLFDWTLRKSSSFRPGLEPERYEF